MMPTRKLQMLVSQDGDRLEDAKRLGYRVCIGDMVYRAGSVPIDRHGEFTISVPESQLSNVAVLIEAEGAELRTLEDISDAIRRGGRFPLSFKEKSQFSCTVLDEAGNAVSDAHVAVSYLPALPACEQWANSHRALAMRDPIGSPGFIALGSSDEHGMWSVGSGSLSKGVMYLSKPGYYPHVLPLDGMSMSVNQVLEKWNSRV
jgi:hypothetical protein